MRHLRVFLILAMGIVACVAFVFSCGGGGGGTQTTIPNVTLENSSGTAASSMKVSGLDIGECPLSTSEIRVGGQTAPALLNDKGEVVMMLPLFYDEATKWPVPPSGLQDVEIYCNGTLLTTLPEAVTVTELQPAPGTTEDIIDDYTQIIADFKEIVAVLVPDTGIQQQLFTALFTAIEELMSGAGADSLPALISTIKQDNPEVLALLDAIHAAEGVDESMTLFKELVAELKNDAVAALSMALPQALTASALSANASPPAQFTSSSANRAATLTIAIPDEDLAELMQLYSTLNPFTEQVLSETEAQFSEIIGLASVTPAKIPYADKVASILKLITYAFKKLLVSPLPATLESIDLTMAKTTLENSEITNSFFTIEAKNIGSEATLTELFDLLVTAMGLLGGGDKTQKWVKSLEETLQGITSLFIGILGDSLKSQPDIPYDIDLFTIIPEMQFEALGFTRELYRLYPLEGGSDIEVIHPLTDQLEWQADDTHWGKAKVFLEAASGIFGDQMATSNIITVTVGEITLVPEFSIIAIPEGESISVGVKLSNQPPEDQPISVYAQRTSGDGDISVASEQPMVFDYLDWDDYKYIVLAAAEDDEDIVNGQATITLQADIDDYGDETLTIIEKITAVEEDNDNFSLVLQNYNVIVPEGELRSVGVKLGNQPPEDQLISVYAQRTSGDSDISVASEQPMVFDYLDWNDYKYIVLAAAEDDEDIVNGQATITVGTDVDDYGDETITATEEDNDVLSFITNTNTVMVPEGSSTFFYIKLNQEPILEPPAPINVTVNFEDGDNDISVASESILVFDVTNWDIFQSVTLYAQPDADIISGEATFKISSSTPVIEDRYVLAIEQEIKEASLVIQGSEFGGLAGNRNWNGVVPVAIKAQSPCGETMEGRGALEFVGFDYWSGPDAYGTVCHYYEYGFIDVNVTGNADCGNPPIYSVGAELIININRCQTCSDGSSGCSPMIGSWKSYAVFLEAQNGYIETYEDYIDSYRVELLLP